MPRFYFLFFINNKNYIERSFCHYCKIEFQKHKKEKKKILPKQDITIKLSKKKRNEKQHHGHYPNKKTIFHRNQEDRGIANY